MSNLVFNIASCWRRPQCTTAYSIASLPVHKHLQYLMPYVMSIGNNSGIPSGLPAPVPSGRRPPRPIHIKDRAPWRARAARLSRLSLATRSQRHRGFVRAHVFPVHIQIWPQSAARVRLLFAAVYRAKASSDKINDQNMIRKSLTVIRLVIRIRAD